jgi:hypothetical protein
MDSITSQQGTPMSLPVKSPSLQSYQLLLYSRALHPEAFPLKGRRVVRQPGIYEFEVWAMSGAHLLRFESRGLCACELVSDQEGRLPEAGVVSAFLCAGERDFEHRFTRDRVTYMTTVQTETLSENLFLATYEEMMDVARATNALLHRWDDETGKCLSMIDIQQYSREVHAQAYHLIATGGLVLRTQTIFEQV